MSLPKFSFFPGTGNPDFTVEVATREFEPERPYPQNPQVIVYRTRFSQLRAYYSKPIPNLPHPNLPQVYFADDIEFQDKLAGMIEWTRVYVTLPTSWNDFASEAYNFPGYQGTLSVLGRNPFTHIVTTKVVRDYYAVGTLTTFQNNLANYDDFNNVSWVKGNTNSAANSTAVPACAGGSIVAAKITETGTTSVHTVSQLGLTQGGTVGAGIFLRASERTKAQVVISNATGIAVGNVAVDLQTGQITVTNGNGSIVAVGDGWFRVGITAASGTGANSNATLQLFLADANGNTSYAGDGTSGLFAWRGQLVSGNAVPYSTVPPTVAGDGNTNYPLATADVVPQKFGTQFLYQVPWGLGATNAVAGQFISEFLSDGGFGIIATSPNLTSYKANVTADAANANSYSIESQDSVQTLWYGSIWERQRKFVKAR